MLLHNTVHMARPSPVPLLSAWCEEGSNIFILVSSIHPIPVSDTVTRHSAPAFRSHGSEQIITNSKIAVSIENERPAALHPGHSWQIHEYLLQLTRVGKDGCSVSPSPYEPNILANKRTRNLLSFLGLYSGQLPPIKRLLALKARRLLMSAAADPRTP